MDGIELLDGEDIDKGAGRGYVVHVLHVLHLRRQRRRST